MNAKDAQELFRKLKGLFGQVSGNATFFRCRDLIDFAVRNNYEIEDLSVFTYFNPHDVPKGFCRIDTVGTSDCPGGVYVGPTKLWVERPREKEE